MAGKRIAIVSTLKKLKAIGAILLFGFLLAACRPMYGETSMGNNATSERAAIEVNELPGRVGQKIRNELIFLFTGGNHPLEPKYKLEIAYRQSVLGILYKRTDDAAGQIYAQG